MRSSARLAAMALAAAVVVPSYRGDPPMERAFVFDAYGTLFDLGSLQSHVEARCPGYGAVITQLWRLKQLEYSWLRSVMGEPFSDFWAVTVQSLQFALTSAGFMLSSKDVEEIASEFKRLRPFPEVSEALRALPARRAILSNGSQEMLNALVSHAGLADVFEFVISVDAARAFKPHPNCYALVETVMNVPRRNVVFVSSNGFDITGAKRFGFTAVWVNRAPPEDSIAPVDTSQLYRLLRTQPEQLGEVPDRTCASLAYIPEIYRIGGF